jgi:hypothetical protein
MLLSRRQNRYFPSMPRDDNAVATLNAIQQVAEVRFGFKRPNAGFEFNHNRLV